MKPSERVKLILEQLTSDNWEQWGKNVYQRKEFERMASIDPLYLFKAILQYLDEEAEKSVKIEDQP